MSFLNSTLTYGLEDSAKMPIIGLSVGMRVVALDKPWEESAFKRTPFVIESQSDIEALREECEFVYVEQEQDTVGMSIVRPGSKKVSKSNIDLPPDVWTF